MFQYNFTVRLSQTDAAGVIYFAEYFNIAHQCYETFLDDIMPVGQGIEQGILMPLVHAEADFQAPLRISQKACVEMTTRTIKHSSYAMDYTIKKTDGTTAATVHTVHAVIDQDWKPCRIPADLAEALKQLEKETKNPLSGHL